MWSPSSVISNKIQITGTTASLNTKHTLFVPYNAKHMNMHLLPYHHNICMNKLCEVYMNKFKIKYKDFWINHQSVLAKDYGAIILDL